MNLRLLVWESGDVAPVHCILVAAEAMLLDDRPLFRVFWHLHDCALWFQED